ncbi:hypothetical protein BB559_006392 [Furculomyces boomerangus]|uniref:Outer kinetochore protein SPC19 n=1 Tax=Furculomyces boomerangus TaxID=61424 RepID=A0A2T9XZI9_9FUNG|nr:hypothetical protein BB559_007021 [Furculomyces boomerangus]PVU86824.1 hypothetical protein BB559_006392 [Furculomyces boomerangus]
MSYIQTLINCNQTLANINQSLARSAEEFASISEDFPLVQSKTRIIKNHDLTTSAQVEYMQDMMSKQAIPFLYRQVEQLEQQLEMGLAESQNFQKEIENSKEEYTQLLIKDKKINELQHVIKNTKLELEDLQASYMEICNLNNTKDKQIFMLQKKMELSKSVDTPTNNDDNQEKILLKSLGILRTHFDKVKISSQNNISDVHKPTFEKGIEIISQFNNMRLKKFSGKSVHLKENKLKYLSRLLKLFYGSLGDCASALISELVGKVAVKIKYSQVRDKLLETYNDKNIGDALDLLVEMSIITVHADSGGNGYISLKIVDSGKDFDRENVNISNTF